MAKDIERAITRLRKIAAAGLAKMERNLILAINDFPTESQIRRLKEVADEMNKTHKAMMKLAAARDSRNFRPGKVYRVNPDTTGINAEMAEQNFGLPGAAHATREMRLGAPDAESRGLRKRGSRCS